MIICFFATFSLCLLSGCPSGDRGKPVLLNPGQMNSPEYSIGVPQGAAAMTAVEKLFPKSKIEYFNTLHDGYLGVLHGKQDAFAFDRHTLQYVIIQNPELALMDEKIADEFISVGAPLGREELMEKVNAFIRSFRKDGTCQDMCQRWLQSKNPKMPEIPEPENPVMSLKIGTEGMNEPMNFYADGRLTGFDIEFSKRLALFLNARISFHTMEFPALIASVSTGKVDLLVANLNAMPERMKMMLFSDTYVDSDISFLVRKDRLPKVADSKLVSSFSDLDGKKIASLHGTAFDDCIDKKIKNAKHIYFNDSASSVEALRSRKVAAWAEDEPVAKFIAARFPDLCILPGMLSQDQYAFAVRKGDGLGQRVSEVIGRFKEDGTIKSLEGKWFGSDSAAKTIPDAGFGDGFDGSAGTIRLGHCNDSEPTSYVDGSGKSLGFDIELALRIAHALNMKVKLMPMNFSMLIEALNDGKVDMAAGCISVTEDRNKRIDFTVPYYSGGQALLVMKAKSGQITGIKQLIGKNIGIVAGSAYDELLKRTIPGAIPEYFNNFTDQAAALKAGKIAGFLADEPIARDIMNNSSGMDYIRERLSSDSYAFAFSKLRPDLCEQANVAIKEMQSDGTLKKLEDKWFGNDEAAKILPDKPIKEENGVLRFATNNSLAPFAYVKDGKMLGYDIEIASMLAEKLGLTLKVEDMDFAVVIPSLVSGKSDMAGGGIINTQERAKSVLFSIPNYSGGVVVMVAKEILPDVKNGVSARNFRAELSQSFRRTFLVEDRYKLVLRGLGVTILITVLSAFFGTLLGFAVCMMRRSDTPWANVPAKIFIRAIQGTPIVVLLMIFYYIVFGAINISGIIVATIAFSINFAAYVSEMMRAGIDSVDKGQHEAAAALGFGTFQTFFLITFPQAARYVLPVFRGEFISMLKMTSVVGYIAIQDLTRMSDIIRSRTYDAFFPLIATALIYFAIASLLTSILSLLEQSIDPKRRKRAVKGVPLP